MYKRFPTYGKAGAGPWDVTEMCKLPRLSTKSCRCAQLSPGVGKSPAGLAFSHHKFTHLDSHTHERGFPFALALWPTHEFLCLVCVLSSCKQLSFSLMSSRKLKGTNPALPCLHYRQIHHWISLRILFPDWCVQKQKGRLWNKEKSFPNRTVLHLFGLVSTYSQWKIKSPDWVCDASIYRLVEKAGLLILPLN